MTVGPVQMLVISFEQPNFTGEIIEELDKLRGNDMIRLIDVLAVQKDVDGTVVALQLSDLSVPEAEELGATVGALIGLGMAGDVGAEAGAILGAEAGADGHLIEDDTMYDVMDMIAPGTAAAIALIEHVWAAPLRGAVARAGGVPVSDAWVHPLDLVEVGLLAADEVATA